MWAKWRDELVELIAILEKKWEPDLSKRLHSVRLAAAMNEAMAQQVDEEKKLLLQN